MNIVNGNLLSFTTGIIGHQVNCQMVMGAGIAKQIRARYPVVFDEYKKVMGELSPENRLGKCQMVEVLPGQFYVANIFSQFHFRPPGVVHTDYGALAMSLRNLNRWKSMSIPKDVEFPIYLPFGIGCGLAGGDWNIVQGIIRDAISDVTIVRLG